MAKRHASRSLDDLPDGGLSAESAAPSSLRFEAYLAGNNTGRQALGVGGQDGEAWLCLEVSQSDAAMLLQHFHALTGRSFTVTISLEGQS